MGFEAGKYKENEKQKERLSEKEIKEHNKKKLEHEKVKEKISIEIQAEEDLQNLKELVEKGVITKETAKDIIEGNELKEDVIKEIFEKIDEIEDIKDIDKYIPDELRINREEYIKAMNDDIFRVQTLTKLDSALTLISGQINPDSAMGLNLFSGFLTILDKNLIKVQENTIDIKESLIEIDNIKFGNMKNKKSLLEKTIEFIKEINK